MWHLTRDVIAVSEAFLFAFCLGSFVILFVYRVRATIKTCIKVSTDSILSSRSGDITVAIFVREEWVLELLLLCNLMTLVRHEED
jgi:hypothetical protein